MSLNDRLTKRHTFREIVSNQVHYQALEFWYFEQCPWIIDLLKGILVGKMSPKQAHYQALEYIFRMKIWWWSIRPRFALLTFKMIFQGENKRTSFRELRLGITWTRLEKVTQSVLTEWLAPLTYSRETWRDHTGCRTAYHPPATGLISNLKLRIALDFGTVIQPGRA